MVSSTLNPQAIHKNSSATLEGFGDFMTGGRASSSSGISDAANKIVDFSRPNVSPIGLNINSLIANISTNILNQVDHSIKTTTNFLKNQVEVDLNQLKNDLYSKIVELQKNINSLQKSNLSDVNETSINDITTRIQEIIKIIEVNKSNSKTEFITQNQFRTELSQVIDSIKDQITENQTVIENNQTENIQNITELTNQIKQIDRGVNNSISSETNNLKEQIQAIQDKISVSSGSTVEPKELQQVKEQIQAIQDKIGGSSGSTVEPKELQQVKEQIQAIQDKISVSSRQSTVEAQTPVSGFQNVIQNIQTQVSNVLDNTLKSFSKDYQQKVKGFDDNRPNIVLTKFLDLHKNAIGFVNFFADRRNIRTIESSLKSLRKIFQESFEVATVIRQTIVKIVKQLSNLPKASSSSGGLDLNIAVPGGKLKQAGGPAVRNVGRGRGGAMLAGAGLLALGGGAGMAISGGMNKAKEYQESMLAQGVSPGEETQNIPENIVESFSAIVDRFTSAVNSLIGGAKKSSGSGSGGGGASPGPSQPPPGPGSTPPPMGEISGNQAEIENQMFDYLRQNYGENVAYGMLSNAMRESGYRTNAPEGGFQGMFQWDKTRWNNLTTWAKSQNLDPMDRRTQLRFAIIESEQLGTLSRMKSAKSPQGAASIFYNEFERAAFSRPIVGTAYTPDNPHEVKNRKFLTEIMGRQQKRTPGSSTTLTSQQTQVTAASQQPQSQVAAAPAQTQAAQAQAQSISKPAQNPLQTISLPPTVIDAGGGQSQGGGGGALQEAPSTQSSGSYSVPMLPTTNPDNFLTMYSRIVYNIVDG